MLQQSTAGTNSSEIKTHNISAILLRLLYNEGISRVHLAESLGVSTATITNLVNELVKMKLVAEEGTIKPESPMVGRPQRALRLVPDARYAIGIHIDVGDVYITLTNLRAEILQTQTLHHALETPWQTILERIAATVATLVDQSGLQRQDIVGVGVAASGLVDPYSGINVFAPNLNWRDVPIREYFAEYLDLPVVVDNNVRAMALGEALFGAAQHVNALAFIYARIGVGAGLVVGGQLYRGAAAGAGEIGHTTIVHEGGEHCHCGNTGCLETLISEPVIIRLAKGLAHKNPEGILARQLQTGSGSLLERVFQAGRAGDVATQIMLEERARYMGIALANLVNVFNPELIVVGGIFRREKSILLPMVEATMRQRAFANLGRQVRIRTSTFGDDSGMVGAVALALDTFFYRPQNLLANGTTAEIYARG